MATRTIYLTVRLNLENPKEDEITDEDIQDIISEMDYNFTAPAGDFTITDTEICGRHDEGGF